jgi:hypothetical protein
MIDNWREREIENFDKVQVYDEISRLWIEGSTACVGSPGH